MKEKFIILKEAINASPSVESSEPQMSNIDKFDPALVIKAHLDTCKDGTPRSTIENYLAILTMDSNLDGKIGYNILLNRPSYTGQLPWREADDTAGDWTDYDEANLIYYIEKNYEINKKSNYNKAFTIICRQHTINPFQDFIEECEMEWDGTERIPTFLADHFGVEGNTEYFAAILENYMFAILSRAIYWPGIKYDYVLVLIGRQGIGKSTFFESLAGDESWFTDSLTDIKGKDAYMQLRGKIIVEMGELTTFKKSDQESLKTFITSQSDYYRLPYDRFPDDYPRRNVFAGTTNNKLFLVDRTGNRRYLPVNLMDITQKKSGIPHAIVRQLWGEAIDKFKKAGYDRNKPNLKLADEIEELALQIQLAHLEEDSWAASIEGYLQKKEVGSVVGTQELYLSAIGETGKPTKSESSRIIAIMNDEIPDWKSVGRRVDKRNGNMKVQSWKKMASPS